MGGYSSVFVYQAPRCIRWGQAIDMREDEVDTVAKELARLIAAEKSPHGDVATDDLPLRHRESAKALIAILDRMRANRTTYGHDGAAPAPSRDPWAATPLSKDDVDVGAVVMYSPPGDRRAYPCDVEKIDGPIAYLTPITPSRTYEVKLDDPDT
jgi:hypothetical protein